MIQECELSLPQKELGAGISLVSVCYSRERAKGLNVRDYRRCVPSFSTKHRRWQLRSGCGRHEMQTGRSQEGLGFSVPP